MNIYMKSSWSVEQHNLITKLYVNMILAGLKCIWHRIEIWSLIKRSVVEHAACSRTWVKHNAIPCVPTNRLKTWICSHIQLSHYLSLYLSLSLSLSLILHFICIFCLWNIPDCFLRIMWTDEHPVNTSFGIHSKYIFDFLVFCCCSLSTSQFYMLCSLWSSCLLALLWSLSSTTRFCSQNCCSLDVFLFFRTILKTLEAVVCENSRRSAVSEIPNPPCLSQAAIQRSKSLTSHVVLSQNGHQEPGVSSVQITCCLSSYHICVT